ncbi:phosphoribosylanthranilate isomerase [Alloacidobacterium sp.]|uniref:phosphoribosylanthranilate isomerase n=1 Tax=Alloacidobacterium sp. TaxID=2951999 RepID=UPI002D27DA9C|nr:phosphoribosylanthranilate isomerase [Alloacidobacterium sp.]HYK37188.1 phosphoribosylanthranilate isomerase [Alloacidobacterium sp.]
MWIKICGNTNLEDALVAAEVGADAIGFVFAESPRRVTMEQVRTITPHLPETLEKYGVFVNWDFEQIVRAVEKGGLTGVQLHASRDPLLAPKLRERFGDALKILRVIHYAGDLGAQLKAAQADLSIDGVLVDSRTATMVGGTGIQFNWQTARRSFRESQLRLVAAGGLSPENVAAAVHTLQPWGVDVSSGVESAPGKKNPFRVKAFVNSAKAAADEITASPR